MAGSRWSNFRFGHFWILYIFVHFVHFWPKVYNAEKVYNCLIFARSGVGVERPRLDSVHHHYRIEIITKPIWLIRHGRCGILAQMLYTFRIFGHWRPSDQQRRGEVCEGRGTMIPDRTESENGLAAALTQAITYHSGHESRRCAP